MEIRRVRTGNVIRSTAEPKKGRSERTVTKDSRPSTDQLELSRQWVAQMDE